MSLTRKSDAVLLTLGVAFFPVGNTPVIFVLAILLLYVASLFVLTASSSFYSYLKKYI